MDINKKIEEIRQKPEHERVRYVFGAVAISMFFLIVIWVISLKDSFKTKQSYLDETGISEQVDFENITQAEE